MIVKTITPVLNVSSMEDSFAWFERLGWKKGWDWGDPVTFGAVYSGTEIQIFLCLNGQGSRGRGQNKTTFGEGGDDSADRGVWMSMWVDDVNEVHEHCMKEGIDITFAPEVMPWGVREMHVRHPDGHVFRVTQALPC